MALGTGLRFEARPQRRLRRALAQIIPVVVNCSPSIVNSQSAFFAINCQLSTDSRSPCSLSQLSIVNSQLILNSQFSIRPGQALSL